MQDDGPFGLALLLAALAGWVDAAGLGGSGGVFLSFMSGNTTDLAASLTQHDWARAETISAVVALFVAGVAAGEIIGPWGGQRGQSLVLACETLALGAGAVLAGWHLKLPSIVPLLPLVFAMGL